MKNRFLSIIRDPIWQLVGVLVSVVALFVAITQTRIAPKEISIIYQYQNRLADRLLPGDKYKLLITDTKYDLERSTVDYYLVINRSGQAVRSTDFVTPLTVAASQEAYRIASVDSCAKEHAQVCSAEVAAGADSGAFVATSWKQRDLSWLAENPLLNSGDIACVAVISEYKDLANITTSTKPNWTARIADFSFRVYKSREEYFASTTSKFTQFFLTSISLEGAAVYWFLLLFGFMLVVTLRIAGFASYADLTSNRGVTVIIILILMAASSAEILVYIFAGGSSDSAVARIHPISWPLLAAHVVVVALLVKSALAQRRRRIEA